LGDIIFWTVIGGAAVFMATSAILYLSSHIGFSRFPSIIAQGFVTFARVVILIFVSTLIWVPVGVKIGMNPRLSRYAQPVVQVLASFPAILIFPFVTAIFLGLGISLNWGAILLMALGAQWYILFNVIAGASAIPNDMVEMMTLMGLTRMQRWRQVILPAVFPAYVTGGITAAGGAWNASIVAELVAWHHTTLNAYGLGNFISNSSNDGKFALLIAGGIVMSAFVVIVNRLFWRRLYRLAENKYSL
jgi:NitT/TauT family transport system permease protein